MGVGTQRGAHAALGGRDGPRGASSLVELPSLGLVADSSPVERLVVLERHLGAGYLGVKRDERLAAHFGGTKLRKLDVLLAEPRFADAQRWASFGAIGSGHVAAVAAIAASRPRAFAAHVFWEPLSAGVLENLAFTASHVERVVFHRSRVALGLSHPTILTTKTLDGAALIPAGATTPEGIAGVARAGFELAAQLAAGELPVPDRVYVALGSGGTAAGLALGLGLAGVATRVHAIAVVERIASTRRRLFGLVDAAAKWLSLRGVPCSAARAVPIVVERAQLGDGYGRPTAQSLAACELASSAGLALEPVYTGKAFAAVLDALAHERGLKILFWQTARRGPLPAKDDWRERLPAALAERLRRTTAPRRFGRRVLLGSGVAAIVAASRLGGYPPLPSWQGRVLSAREAQIVSAAAEALVTARPGPGPVEIAANVDRYLVSMPPEVQLQIHALLALVEHGTTPLGLWWSRLTSLDVAARASFLASLAARGGLLAQAARGLRDLVMLGFYQSPSTWPELGYDGPWGEAAGPELAATPYERFRADAGALPRGTERAGAEVHR
ncbi:pyridoxal-phosphate dependent enzyme [Myxococcota bacterium]|nr:pyridoxal-phosphate dependent enzyme [Myxococcota bacterium]